MEGQCKAGQILRDLALELSLAGLQAATLGAANLGAAKELLLPLLQRLADTQPSKADCLMGFASMSNVQFGQMP